MGSKVFFFFLQIKHSIPNSSGGSSKFQGSLSQGGVKYSSLENLVVIIGWKTNFDINH